MYMYSVGSIWCHLVLCFKVQPLFALANDWGMYWEACEWGLLLGDITVTPGVAGPPPFQLACRCRWSCIPQFQIPRIDGNTMLAIRGSGNGACPNNYHWCLIQFVLNYRRA